MRTFFKGREATKRASVKMSSGKLEFSDMYHEKKSRGCYVTPLKALGFVLAAAAVATAVGLLVYYKHPDYGQGSQQTAAVAVTPGPGKV